MNTNLGTLRNVGQGLRAAGLAVELREPDAEDPLGGVVDVRGSFGLVQIVNYGDRFPAVIDGGIAMPDTVIRPGSHLRIVPLPHLVAPSCTPGARSPTLTSSSFWPATRMPMWR